jgi:hypothetical protein
MNETVGWILGGVPISDAEELLLWLGLGLHGGCELMDGRRNGALAGLGWATRLAVLLCGGA